MCIVNISHRVTVKLVNYLPFLFHQKITSLKTQVIIGKVHIKLSVTSKMSKWTLIRECIAGIIRASIINKKIRSTRKLHKRFSHVFCLDLGQSPINSRLNRFNSTAHSKSVLRKV